MKEKIELIKEAIKCQGSLRIRYRAGSEPERIREIGPLSLDGETLRACCFTSGMVRIFRLEELEILTTEDPA